MATTDIRTNTTPEIGLSSDDQNAIVDVLSTVLADEHVIYIKLRNFHWNVTGPHFHSLHEMFEEQYTGLAETIDEIAERIRQYGAFAPGTMETFLDRTRLSEEKDVPDARDMVRLIVEDHEAFIRHVRGDIEKVGEQYGDVGAEDFLIGILQDHQERAWMLRSMLDKDALD
jgi:starvation-inducible DNA-binding protein